KRRGASDGARRGVETMAAWRTTQTSSSTSARALLVLWLALSAAPALAPAAHARLLDTKAKTSREQKKAIEKLAPQYRAWLEEVEVLITKEEKRAFLELQEDYQRDAFIEHFWQVRDRGAINGEFRHRWEARVEE